MSCTAGPWKCEEWDWAHDKRGGHVWQISRDDGKPIMVCEQDKWDEGSFTPPSPDDLALILTAPEQQAKIDALLAACKAMVAVLDVDNLTMQTIEHQANAAIAKAEGKQG